MYCRFCGAQILDDSSFCHCCGKSLSESSEYHYTRQELNQHIGETAPRKNSFESDVATPECSSKPQKSSWRIIALIISIILILAIILYVFGGSKDAGTTKATSADTPTRTSKLADFLGIEGTTKATNASTPTPKSTVASTPNPALPLPKTGTVFIGSNLSRYSELTIESSSSNSYYIKLKNSSLKDVFSFFVRAGESVTMDVPEGKYYVYFASGDEWYGKELLFGEDTVYAKDDELLDFSMYTFSYTLYPVINGNFSETPIDASEF